MPKIRTKQISSHFLTKEKCSAQETIQNLNGLKTEQNLVGQLNNYLPFYTVS
jgi:hypothetical protein